MTLVRAIVADDTATATTLLTESKGLARACAAKGASRQETTDYFFDEIVRLLQRHGVST